MNGLRLEIMDGCYTVCRIADPAQIDWSAGLLFVGKTDEELSLVCPEQCAPDSCIRREDGWRAFRIAGELDFSLTGILAGIAQALAEEGIGIFAVSTYNTDYVLTKKDNFGRAVSALARRGYETGEWKECGTDGGETPS